MRFKKPGCRREISSRTFRVFRISASAIITQIVLVFPAFAQEHVHADHGTFEPVFDGSARPQDIPDSVAIRVLMQSLQASVNEGPGLTQLYSRVQRAELSNADVQILVREVRELDTQAQVQEARLQAARPASEAADEEAVAHYRAEGEFYGDLIVDQYREMLRSMSPEGAAKMMEHLDHVKARIKIYPSPDMSASGNPNGPGEIHE
jgi:hypothetical protein